MQHSLEQDAEKAPLLPALRRMTQSSELSLQAGPHLGLGVAHYATITSPIRRFADLYNHWCIKAIISQSAMQHPLNDEACGALNDVLINIRKADRELQQWLICLYTESLKNTQAKGKIRIVTQQGFGVRLIENGIEGFVLFSKDCEKVFDAKRMTLKVGERLYRMDEEVEIAIKSVDMDKRRIAFELA